MDYITRIYSLRHLNRLVCGYSNYFPQHSRNLSLSHNVIRKASLHKSPPLLMMHGLLGNKRNFNLVNRLMQKSLPNTAIITCDLRNHGDSPHSDVMDYLSMRDDTLELLHFLGIEECFLLGHSLGGRIAMNVALAEPEKVKKLIVVDVSPGVKGEERSVSKGAFEYVKAMDHVKFDKIPPRSSAKGNVDKQLMSAVSDKSVRDFVLTNVVRKPSGAYGWRVNVKAILSNREHISYLGNDHGFEPYQRDALFLTGEKSDYVTSSDIPEIKRLFPNSVLKSLSNCGHWVHADDPDAFSTAVSEFVS